MNTEEKLLVKKEVKKAKKHVRVQTAEGWMRSQSKEKKKQSKK